MLSFLSCVAATLATATWIPFSAAGDASYFNGVDYNPRFNGYFDGIPIGTTVGEVTKSSPVLQVRVPAPYARGFPSYASAGVDRTPLFALSSENAVFARSFISKPGTVPSELPAAAAYVQGDSPLISAVRLKTPPSLGAQGVEYAPDEHKPYDPAVHLNEPAKYLSPKYLALSGIIASVGQVALDNKNDPRNFGHTIKA